MAFLRLTTFHERGDMSKRFAVLCLELTEMVAGVYLHDPTVLLAAVNPSLITFAEGSVRVQTAGITKGLTLFRSNIKRSSLSSLPNTKC